MRRAVLQRMRVFTFVAALSVSIAGSSFVVSGEIPYAPDAEIEQAINQALQSDGAVGERAFRKLVERGADAEKAIDWNMQRAASNQRAKWAELFARLNRGKVAYRITMELKPDGAGALELWSNRSALAECGRKNDRIHGRPETTYSIDDLKYNPYSRVELLKFFPTGDAVKHLEARVEQPTGDIEARGMIAFKNFESLSSFADQFDAGGYHMLTGATLTDAGTTRTYSFRKPAETDRVLYEKNLMLFHSARWEFVFDFKGAMGRNNAHRADGTKLIWTFNCYELLNGLASIQVSFDSTGLPPRAIPPAAILGDAPQASVKNAVLNVKVFRRGPGALPPTKELRERNCLVELDGRESQPAGDGLQYRWRQTSGADLNIPTPDLARAYLCLIVKEPGEYRFELVVSKNGIYSQPAEVKLFVTDDTTAQTAPKPQPPPVAATTPVRVPERPPEKKPEPAPPAQTNAAAPDIAKTEPKPTRAVDLSSETKPAPVAPAIEKKPEVAQATPAETKKPEPARATPPIETAKAAPPEKKVPAGNAKELAAQGLAYFKGGNYAEAKRVLLQSVEIDGSNFEAQNTLGLTLLELGEYPTAARQFEEVAQNTRSAKAMMNVGHSFARAGNLREAGTWYRRGAAVGRDQVEWEPRWQLANIELRDKNYKEALKLLKEAEAMATKVKDRDVRLYKDLAVAYLNNGQPNEALQSIKIVQDLGYTADPELVASVRKAAGGAAPVESKAPEVAKTAPAKTDPPKTEAVKTEPVKTDVAKADPPKTDVKVDAPPAETKKPVTPVVQTTPAKISPTPEKTEPAAVQKTPEPPKTEAVVTAPPPPKKKEAKPLPPKRPLPAIPSDFESALAGGKKALESATALTAQNTDSSKLEAHYKYDEAEAMLRAAWSRKPGDEQTIAAFRDLAKHVGAIALVNNTQIRAKAGGLVVLDAEPSIGPKDKTLFYAWEQVEGEPLEVRPESLAQKRVGLKIRKPGMYRFDLAVSDGSKGGNPVSVTVEVSE